MAIPVYSPLPDFVGQHSRRLPVSGVTAPLTIVGTQLAIENSVGATVLSVSTDPTLAAASDTVIATQAATKAYADAVAAAMPPAAPPIYNTGTLVELRNDLGAQVTTISTSTSLAPGDDVHVPTQGAVGSFTSSWTANHAFTSATAPLSGTPPSPVKLVNSVGATVTSVSTDPTLAANSDTIVATQKATKGYADAHAIPPVDPPIYSTGTNLVLRNTLAAQVTAISPSTSLSPGDDVTVPTQGAVGSYVSSWTSNNAYTSASAPLTGTPPNPLRIINSNGNTVTSVSTDGTFTSNSDTLIPTQKATKTYIASVIPGTYITSVTAPLSVTLGNLSIADASAISSGVVTTGIQTLAGAKTLTGHLLLSSTGSQLSLTDPLGLGTTVIMANGSGRTAIDQTSGIDVKFGGVVAHTIAATSSVFTGTVRVDNLSIPSTGAAVVQHSVSPVSGEYDIVSGLVTVLTQNGVDALHVTTTAMTPRVMLQPMAGFGSVPTPTPYTVAVPTAFNNYILQDDCYIARFDVTAGNPSSFTGFDFNSVPKQGHEIKLFFVATSGIAIITIAHEHAGSLAGNRIWTPTTANLTLTCNPLGCVGMWYSNLDNRWLVSNYQP